VRAVLHGHQLVGARPVSVALVDRAVRLLVARALDHILREAPADELDSAAAHPLALVEATLRGHGLDAYASDRAASSRCPEMKQEDGKTGRSDQ
jgi:lysine-N-methylase